ncbi:DUF397 domain-containing protein [Nocardiopsis tropica]|uniref:DUF397 domain-containing protein n=1 Tax=Nocardiopsis tropica TaxID=109330 RepID=A0ABU7KX52_9ACTN|nr:DUF397 domain-containing protein [Nocardiopsis umidischolae]MEE2053854.1 DUF397 domain-containing protein [Nocardiopsis umidischolae]
MSELAPSRSGHSEATPQKLVDVAFHKSSYSDRSDCVEVAFRKSSYSATANDCVEVADVHGASLVRDTQNRKLGHLAFPSSEWRALLGTARREK